MSDIRRSPGLYAKKSLVVQYVAMAVACGALTAVTLAGGRASGSLFPLAVAIWMAVWYTSRPVVQAFGQHLTIKAAPLAGKRLIAYDQIVAVEQTSAKKASLAVRDGSRVRKVKLPMNLLTPADGARLLGLLRSRMPGSRCAA